MAWTVYRWDDAGAPTLSAASSSLITLLDAVLIGTMGFAYGTTPSAGWTGGHISSTQAKYINGGTGHGILVTHNAASNLPSVVGIEGGNEAGPFFPTKAQITDPRWGISDTADSTARPWIIFADNKRFYLWVGYNLTTAQALSASTTFQLMHFAGDILNYKGTDGYHFMVTVHVTVAVNNNSIGYYAGAMNGTLADGHYMCRSHTQSAGAVKVGKLADFALTGSASSGKVTSMAYPDQMSGGISISPTRIFEQSVWGPRGIMPGMWFLNHNMPGNNGDTFPGAAIGPLAGKSFMLLDSIVTGSRVRVAMETSDTIGF